jgi:hypothetical protein
MFHQAVQPIQFNHDIDALRQVADSDGRAAAPRDYRCVRFRTDTQYRSNLFWSRRQAQKRCRVSIDLMERKQARFAFDSICVKLFFEPLRQSIDGKLHRELRVGRVIGAFEEFHQVIDFYVGSVFSRAIAELQHATGIGGNHGIGFG